MVCEITAIYNKFSVDRSIVHNRNRCTESNIDIITQCFFIVASGIELQY